MAIALHKLPEGMAAGEMSEVRDVVELYTNPLADGFEESTDAVLDGHFRLWWLKSNSKQILTKMN